MGQVAGGRQHGIVLATAMSTTSAPVLAHMRAPARPRRVIAFTGVSITRWSTNRSALEASTPLRSEPAMG